MASVTANHRRIFSICGERFVFPGSTTADVAIHVGTIIVEYAVLILGPMLIAFAIAIIGGLSQTFFTIILPMLQMKYNEEQKGNGVGSIIVAMHIIMVIFLVVEITFHYYMCVTTRNKGPNYDRVVRELAKATNFQFPETPQELEQFRREVDDKMMLRLQRRQMMNRAREEAIMVTEAEGSNNSTTTTTVAELTEPTLEINNDPNSSMKQRKPHPTKSSAAPPPPPNNNNRENKNKIRPWMLMAPDEWGYCNRSNQPKPPRSHYDHVSKTLVLCLDHYCPWMFNVVGYFNYRYFCSFLWYVEIAMIYAGSITYEPFQNTGGKLYRMQRDNFRKTGIRTRMFPMVPFPDERLKVSLACMLSLSIGLAVACLGGFHLYLCLTGQTTIEFHGNWMNRRRAKRLNKKYQNPYDLGWKRNWQQVFGSSRNCLLAFLIPSTREPEFLPIPILNNNNRNGGMNDASRRCHYSSSQQQEDYEKLLPLQQQQQQEEDDNATNNNNGMNADLV
eukprot:scaffold675_cov103-Cylindrotheca_fusiformis.AAC.25